MNPLSRLSQQARRRGDAAFTLVELLLAVAVMAVMLVMLSQVVGSAGRIWVGGQQRAENLQSVRAILDTVGRDLSASVISSRLQFVQNPGNPSGGLTPLLSSGVQQTPNTDSLFWQAQSANTPEGNLAQVGYFVTHTDGTTQYQLRRYYVPEDSADFVALDAAPSYGNNFPTAPAWIYLPGGKFLDRSQVLADGVLALWVRCLDANGRPIPWLSQAPGYSGSAPMKYNSAAPFLPEVGPSGAFYTQPEVTLPAHRLPACIELTMVMIDSRTLDRGVAIPDVPAVGSPEGVPAAVASFMEQLLAQGIKTARVFSTIVKLPNSNGDG